MYHAPNTIGNIIKRKRLEAVQTQREFANKIGISRKSLCEIETGRVIPLPGTVRKIASGLNMKPEELVKESDNWIIYHL